MHIYHSLGETYTIQLCGDKKYPDTKHDRAVVYADMEYVMYPIDKKFLGKRKRSFWSTFEQENLECLITNNRHLAPKDLGIKLLSTKFTT